MCSACFSSSEPRTILPGQLSCPHFTDEKTETQRWRHLLWTWRGSEPGLCEPRAVLALTQASPRLGVERGCSVKVSTAHRLVTEGNASAWRMIPLLPLRRLRERPCRGVHPCPRGRVGGCFPTPAGLLSVWVEEPTTHPGPEGRRWGRARVRATGGERERESWRHTGREKHREEGRGRD